MTTIRKSTLRKTEMMARVTEYIATIGEFTIKLVADELGMSKENVRRYINEMRELGLISVLRESCNLGSQIQPAVYMTGMHATTIVQFNEDCEPYIAPTTRWAHGAATRYAMGRAI